MINVRNTALSSIVEIIEDGKKSHYVTNETVKKEALSKEDRALYLKLVEGTIERKLTLDAIINKYSKTPLNKLKKVVRNLLRMSIYQIIYLDKIPDSAAVDEAVKIIKKRKMGALSGFVNGVLRNIVRNKQEVIEFIANASDEIKYSLPQWIIDTFGEHKSTVLENLYKPRRINARVNLSKHSYEEVKDMLISEGVEVCDNPYFEDIKEKAGALYISDFGDLRSKAVFAMGLISIQDTASMLPAIASGVKKGDVVIDVCSAPGGKSTQVAELLKETGQVHAWDLTEKKIALIKDNIKRIRLKNIDTRVHDGRNTLDKYRESADVLILDVPCSGIGVISNKPDIKYRLKKEDIKSLQNLQKEIVKASIPYLKKGGVLIYSTCTITKEEDEDMFEYIKDNFDMTPDSLDGYIPKAFVNEDTKKGYLKIIPGLYEADGFFVARFVKN